MRKLNVKFVSLALILLICIFCSAQQKQSKWPEDAPWIKMMADPNVNYYEAVKSYYEYWKTHKKPVERTDEMRNVKKGDKREVPVAKVSPQQKAIEDEMVYQVKRFETWMREEKPFVQENGRILSEQERIEIWKKQQQEKGK